MWKVRGGSLWGRRISDVYYAFDFDLLYTWAPEEHAVNPLGLVYCTILHVLHDSCQQALFHKVCYHVWDVLFLFRSCRELCRMIKRIVLDY